MDGFARWAFSLTIPTTKLPNQLLINKLICINPLIKLLENTNPNMMRFQQP